MTPLDILIKTVMGGEERFYGAHEDRIISGPSSTIEQAEEALLTEIKKRAIRESGKATRRAADLSQLTINLFNNGFKGYRVEP